MNIGDPDFTATHIPAIQTKIFHPCKDQFTQIAVFHAGSDEWHGNVSLDSVDSRPRGDECHDLGDQVDQDVGRVILVPARLPQFVEAGAANNKGRVDLESIRAEQGVLEILTEPEEIAFKADVREIGHHVRNDLEPAVFGELEGFADGADGVAAIGVTSDILVDALNTDLESCTPVPKHLAQMGLEAVIRASLDSDPYTLHRGLLGIFHGLVNVLTGVACESVVESSDEVVAVILVQGHESTAHDDVLDFVDGVAQAFELFDTIA